MKLFGAITKVEAQDDGTVRVHGIATSEAVDDQGEIVRAAAIREAIPEYMRFPALREMHQLMAAGTTLEAEVDDEGVTRIVAHVVDPIAVSKVKAQVYRGFSIGGRVTKRDAGNSKTITGLVLNEISLVDRPANPEAIFDCWKASTMNPETQAADPASQFNPIQVWHCGDPTHTHLAKAEATKCVEKRAGSGADQLQAAVDAALKAVQDGEPAVAAADPVAALPAVAPNAEQNITQNITIAASEPAAKTASDMVEAARAAMAAGQALLKAGDDAKKDDDIEMGAKRKPRLASAKAVLLIERAASPAQWRAAFAKALWDVGQVAEIILSLDWLQERLEYEAAMEGDNSPQPDRLQAVIAELCGFLNALVAEETQEILADTDRDDDDDAEEGMQMGPVAMSAIAGSLRKTVADKDKAEMLVEQIEKAGARHGKATQAQLDTAAYAIHKAMGIGTMKRGEMSQTGQAYKAVLDAGATALNADGREMLTDSNPTAGSPTQHSTTDTGHNAQTAVPNPTGASPAAPYPGMAKAVGGDFAAIDAMIKAGRGHVDLLLAAHDLVCASSDGATCKDDAARPGHLSVKDMASLHETHDHLMAVDGVACAAGAEAAGEPTHQGTETDTSKAAAPAPAALVPGERVVNDDLAKVLADERAEKAVLVKTLSEIVPLMAQMQKRIEDIAAQPLPPAAVANVGATDARRSDSGAARSELTSNEIAKALADMSPTESTVTMIKAAQQRPIRIARYQNAVTQREMVADQS